MFRQMLALAALVLPLCAQPNPYHIIENWAKFPAGRAWGSSSGVAIDRDGTSVWVADRCGANSCAGKTVAPILKFDAAGNLVKSFGEGLFVFPHGLYVDHDGNIWVTDGQGKDGKGHRFSNSAPMVKS
jgi:DNA-binding beta-propeller fold protein YncE